MRGLTCQASEVPAFHVKHQIAGQGMFHVNHTGRTGRRVSRESLADTELREDHVEKVFNIHRAGYTPQPVTRLAQIVCPELQVAVLLPAQLSR